MAPSTKHHKNFAVLIQNKDGMAYILTRIVHNFWTEYFPHIVHPHQFKKKKQLSLLVWTLISNSALVIEIKIKLLLKSKYLPTCFGFLGNINVKWQKTVHS